MPNNLLETTHKNAKGIVKKKKKEKRVVNNQNAPHAISNIKLTGDIIYLVNSLRFSERVNTP